MLVTYVSVISTHSYYTENCTLRQVFFSFDRNGDMLVPTHLSPWKLCIIKMNQLFHGKHRSTIVASFDVTRNNQCVERSINF